jgi:hypothetical protein
VEEIAKLGKKGSEKGKKRGGRSKNKEKEEGYLVFFVLFGSEVASIFKCFLKVHLLWKNIKLMIFSIFR